MAKIIRVLLKKNSYEIIVGNKLSSLIKTYLNKAVLGNDAYIISNPTIYKKYSRELKDALDNKKISYKFKLVEDSEKSKSLASVASVIKDISGFDRRKKIFIIAFGGGVVGDLAGFVASIYKRGIPYIQIPTSLLAQVDSSIGGKTGVDLTEGKNLVGAFYQPRLVISDVSLLKTLNLRQLRTGMAEVIKYGLIKDKTLFRFLEKNHRKILSVDLKSLEHIISSCAKIKAEVVTKDEKEEKGIRTILNFGHTFGHAIEAAGGFQRYNHGEAVGLGMLLASRLSLKLNLLNYKTYNRIESLISQVGLPTKIKGIKAEEIIKAHFRDKKFSGKRNKFVLLEKIGKTKITEDIGLALIKDVLKDRLS